MATCKPATKKATKKTCAPGRRHTARSMHKGRGEHRRRK